MQINGKGRITSLQHNGKQYAAVNHPGWLLCIVNKDDTITPVKATFDHGNIRLLYDENISAQIKVVANQSYITFTLISVSKDVDAIKWGPFNTVISDTIGNTVGVVRSKDYAIGIQCLNKKTTGGELVNEEGAVFDRGTTAEAQPFGSSLQAFTINRSHDRKITVWNRWPNVPVKAITDGSLTGSAIAIFGCEPPEILPVIKTITRQEGLPFAQWKGGWIKQSEETGRPYMITTFSESDIDTLLNYAKEMGMAGVYHEDPFETWGHFILKKSLFPHGIKGFKACVDKAHAMGLRLGFHTLSNFITTNDSFVTPKPNRHLASAGSSVLTKDISAGATEIFIKDNKYFTLKSDLNSIRIGDEIIRYTSVSDQPPYCLTGCVRGAFGTQKSIHKAGDEAGRLIDHPYKVFFPDWKLQKEIAANIARFINETGADQMDFDGHEGTYATGMGDLSFNTFAEDVFRMSDHPVVFGSSRDNHYFWHFNDYLNWGEPWYGSFRESQTDTRISNQQFYEANYLPNMLGWFLITAQTSPEDVEWMLAKAAGYNAGYALVLRKEALNNPAMDEITRLIGTWTSAQRKKMFNAEQKSWLRNTSNEAHLLSADGKFYLQRLKKFDFEYSARVLQPGQPTSQSWDFENTQPVQVPAIVIRAKGEDGNINNAVIDIDNNFHLVVPVTLNAGQSLVLNNGNHARLYDRKGKLIKQIKLDKGLPQLNTGQHTLSFDGTTDVNSSVELNIEIKLAGKKELLK